MTQGTQPDHTSTNEGSSSSSGLGLAIQAVTPTPATPAQPEKNTPDMPQASCNQTSLLASTSVDPQPFSSSPQPPGDDDVTVIPHWDSDFSDDDEPDSDSDKDLNSDPDPDSDSDGSAVTQGTQPGHIPRNGGSSSSNSLRAAIQAGTTTPATPAQPETSTQDIPQASCSQKSLLASTSAGRQPFPFLPQSPGNDDVTIIPDWGPDSDSDKELNPDPDSDSDGADDDTYL